MYISKPVPFSSVRLKTP